MRLLSKTLSTAAVAVALGFAVGAPSALADYSTNTLALGVAVTTTGATNPGLTAWSFTATIPQFTLSLAGVNADCSTTSTCTLTGVTVVVSDSAYGSMTLVGNNNGSNGSLQFFSIGAQAVYNNPFTNGSPPNQLAAAWNLCDTTNVSLSGGNACTNSNTELDFTPGQSITATLQNDPSDTATYNSTNALILSELDSGTLQFTGSTSSYTNGTNNNNVQITPDIGAQVSGTVKFTYTDTPTVPEPATLALLGVGLAGMGFVRRRRA